MITTVTDPLLPPGVAYLVSQPYADWKRDQPAGSDVSLEAWLAACVVRLA